MLFRWVWHLRTLKSSSAESDQLSFYSKTPNPTVFQCIGLCRSCFRRIGKNWKLQCNSSSIIFSEKNQIILLSVVIIGLSHVVNGRVICCPLAWEMEGLNLHWYSVAYWERHLSQAYLEIPGNWTLGFLHIPLISILSLC